MASTTEYFGPHFSDYPPSPVLWFTCFVDTLCLPLQCSQWRETLNISQDSWLAPKVPFLLDSFPPVLTYEDFLQQEDGSAAAPWSFASLYQYVFETNNTALGDLTTPTSCLVLLFLVIILRNIKAVLLPYFSSIGRKAGRRTHGVDWEYANEERIYKFGEYVYRLICHSMISLYGVYYFKDKAWWAYEGFRHVGGVALFKDFRVQQVEPGMALYYLLQAAYNVDAMVTLLEISFVVELQSPFVKQSGRKIRSPKIQSPIVFSWSKTARGDFTEMFVHHVITNLLIFGSSVCHVTRSGSMVFLVHDLSDIPVDLSKLANFLKWKVTTITCFATMTFCWMLCRLYVLPFVILKAFVVDSHYMCEDPEFPDILFVCYRYIFWGLLVLLIMLHVSWFLMFVRMFVTLVKKNECHDYSEHRSGENQNLYVEDGLTIEQKKSE